MNDPILERLKEQKLRELQSQANTQESEGQQLKNQIAHLEHLIKKYLTRDALIRYGNIKTANPDKAVQVLSVLSQLIQYKKENEKITDDELKSILKRIQEQKRETKIQFTK